MLATSPVHSVLLYAVDAMHENTAKLNGFGTRATNTTTFLRGIPAGVQRTIYITLPYIFCSISFNFMLLLCSASQGACILLLHQEASIFVIIKHKACATVTFFHLGLPSCSATPCWRLSAKGQRAPSPSFLHNADNTSTASFSVP